MTPLQRQYESQAATLASSYRQQGYTVATPANPASIPFDLHGFAPDLLAEKDTEHLVLLFNNPKHPVSIDRLRDVAEAARQQPGWRVLLVNLAASSEVSGLPIAPLGWASIEHRIAQGKRLFDTGDVEAAVLLLWSALEALLRRHAESLALPIEHLSAQALLDYLYSDADLSYEHFDQANKLLTGRNQLAHGFPLPEAAQQAAQLQGLIEDLSGDWLPLREAA